MFNRNAGSLILCRFSGYLSLLYLYTYTVPFKLPHVSPWRNECCCLTVVVVRLTREREGLSWMMVLLIKYMQVSHEHTEPMTHTHTHSHLLLGCCMCASSSDQTWNRSLLQEGRCHLVVAEAQGLSCLSDEETQPFSCTFFFPPICWNHL